jgi:hypothetical protein
MLAIDVGFRDLHAVEAVAERGRIVINRVVQVQLPEATADTTPEQRGAQVRELLNAAGVSATGAVWTLPRERVVFKKLDLPGAEPHELPGMVHLAMQHETSMNADSVIDYVVQAGSGNTREVWAVGAPANELEVLRRMADAAGITVDRVAPRTCGTSALLASLASAPEASALGELAVAFDLSSESAELVAADGAGLRATRGTTLSSGTPEAAVTEARRSWTALRLSQPDLGAVRAWVLGDAGPVAALASAIGGDIQVAKLDSHPDIQTDGQQLGCAWPLAGLLLESVRQEPSINLAHPRKAPDVAARRRIRVYAAVAVVAAAYCVGWAVGKQDRQSLETQRVQLVSQESKARTEYLRIKRDELKARHLNAWLTSQPQWLDTMLHLHGFAPDPARVLFASWGGQVEEAVVGVSKDGVFSLPPAVRISMDVETTDRAMADALREALIARREWVVKSTSSEGKVGRRLPVAVELLLLAPTGTPVEKEPAPVTVSRRGMP